MTLKWVFPCVRFSSVYSATLCATVNLVGGVITLILTYSIGVPSTKIQSMLIKDGRSFYTRDLLPKRPATEVKAACLESRGSRVRIPSDLQVSRNKMPPWRSLRDREVACSASDCQGSNFEICFWSAVSSHHPQAVLLAQFSLLCAQRWPKTPFISFQFSKIVLRNRNNLIKLW